jgi:hypothetical protein
MTLDKPRWYGHWFWLVVLGVGSFTFAYSTFMWVTMD